MTDRPLLELVRQLLGLVREWPHDVEISPYVARAHSHLPFKCRRCQAEKRLLEIEKWLLDKAKEWREVPPEPFKVGSYEEGYYEAQKDCARELVGGEYER